MLPLYDVVLVVLVVLYNRGILQGHEVCVTQMQIKS